MKKMIGDLFGLIFWRPKTKALACNTNLDNIETVKTDFSDQRKPNKLRVLVGQKISKRVLARMLNTRNSPKSSAALRESRQILGKSGLGIELCSNPKHVRVVSLS